MSRPRNANSVWLTKAEMLERFPMTKGERTKWLNGWPLLNDGRTVLMGTSTHCAGCGQFEGVTCVVFPPDWTAPEKEPDWPFEEGCCGVCCKPATPEDKRQPTLEERLAAFKAVKARS